MYGNTQLTTVLGAAPRPTNEVKTWVGYARSLAKIGLPIILLQPDESNELGAPLDMRTPRECAKDEEADLGLATSDPARLANYVRRAFKKDPEAQLNWAVRMRGSGYVVAEASDLGGEQAVREWLRGMCLMTPGPTILTPTGLQWWLHLPSTVDAAWLPNVLHTATVDGESTDGSVGADHFGEAVKSKVRVLAGDVDVPIPPSTSEQGAWELAGGDVPAPTRLVTELQWGKGGGTALSCS